MWASTLAVASIPDGHPAPPATSGLRMVPAPPVEVAERTAQRTKEAVVVVPRARPAAAHWQRNPLAVHAAALQMQPIVSGFRGRAAAWLACAFAYHAPGGPEGL